MAHWLRRRGPRGSPGAAPALNDIYLLRLSVRKSGARRSRLTNLSLELRSDLKRAKSVNDRWQVAGGRRSSANAVGTGMLLLNGAVMYSRSAARGCAPSVVMTRPSKVAGPKLSLTPDAGILIAWPLTKLPSAVLCDALVQAGAELGYIDPLPADEIGSGGGRHLFCIVEGELRERRIVRKARLHIKGEQDQKGVVVQRRDRGVVELDVSPTAAR